MPNQITRREFLKRTSFGIAGLTATALLKPGTLQGAPLNSAKPNLLFIMTDQQRFDAIRRVQDELADYRGKTKIRTPNLDRLSLRGAYFINAYSQCPVCAPDRTVLRTGCTIERSGAQSNSLVKESMYNRMSQFKDKILALESFEQILVEDYGYVSEYYGKWHMPERFHFERSSATPVIDCNDYDYASSSFRLRTDESWGSKYTRYLTYFDSLGEISKTFSGPEQQDTFSKYAYTPIQLDARYGYPTNTPLTTAKGFAAWETSQPNVSGRFSLSENYTAIHYNGEIAVKALDRLAQQNNPFVLTASFHNPHAPMVTPSKYLDYYWDNRDDLFVSPSINDAMSNSAYSSANGRANLLGAGHAYDNPEHVKEWIACYYGMVEEIDEYVGQMLDKLDEYGITGNTMIVFTSDHGEMLGAHAMREKNIFLEESVHIPLLIAFPGQIPPQTIIEEPVSHLDLFSTLLDYLNAGASDNSDGTSMRRFIEGTSYNKNYDERAVVAEWDFRDPKEDGRSLARSLGGETNFMILKGNYKLMLTKKASSSRLDMMYNLADDPYEVNNLVGNNGMTASKAVIGKAEHLKILLIEWMQRMDGGAAGYYSNPVYNANEGSGDIAEVNSRRKWKTLSLWFSDTKLDFGRLVWTGSAYERNEYLYMGRATSGTAKITSISVKGADASYFSVDTTSGILNQNDYLKVKVTFSSLAKVSIDDLDAYIEISNNIRGHGTTNIQLGGNDTTGA